MQSHINVGFGSDITISELAHAVGAAVGYQGTISFDPSKPDGSPRKWIDSARINRLGWKARVDLSLGLKLAYEHFLYQSYQDINKLIDQNWEY
jgi:GDP-L-fucose synthase